ncbi:MAG TPA: FecR family protein [Vicinamibacterales bacterium]|jgi:ferric-dicitrate binding protein FerR (iron transport regulator)|nr:FecR family protein [Vicinamibacterales bacterium]
MIRDKDDNALAELLRRVGPPPPIAADRTARVRRTVRGAWDAQLGARARRRRIFAAITVPALAAGLLVVFGVPKRGPVKPAEPVARVLSTDAPIYAGDVFDTGSSGPATLQLDTGTSLRADRHTSIRVHASRRVELLHGAVYVDNRGQAGRAIEIQTPFGTVHDVGTQFETRLIATRLRVRVRSGFVSVHDGPETASGGAGTEFTAGAGPIQRSRTPVYGPDWDWVAEAAPTFEIEGRTLAAFLEHVSRERGWTLRFSSASVERTAAETILHGSIEGLSVEDSLATVVPASGLLHALRDGVLTLSPVGTK